MARVKQRTRVGIVDKDIKLAILFATDPIEKDFDGLKSVQLFSQSSNHIQRLKTKTYRSSFWYFIFDPSITSAGFELGSSE